MYRSLGRRLSFSAVAVAAAITVAAPAYAAAPIVNVTQPDVTLGPGTSTKVVPIVAGDPATVRNATMTFELSGELDGVTLSDPDEICHSESPAKLVCTVPEYDLDPDGERGQFTATLTAAQAARGKTGKITETFTADGVEEVTQTAGVTVTSEDAVDLAAGEDAELSAKPGAGFAATLEVTGTSDDVVHGAAVVFGTDYAFMSPTEFSNCLYRDERVTACVFDQDFQPGTTYQVGIPYQLRKDTAAPGHAAGEFEWLTIGDYEDRLTALKAARTTGNGVAGHGGTLALQAKPATARLGKQTDPNPDNNVQRLTVNVLGQQGTDLVAVGATAHGKNGDTITVPVGVRNDGPATLDHGRSGDAAAVIVVTMPAGAEVTTVPDGCAKADADTVRTNPKVVQYDCYSALLFKAKTTTLWKFGVKLTKDVTNGQGLVEVNPPCGCGVFEGDINKKNDNAKIVINPISGGSDTDDGTDAGTGGGTDGQGGGSLPITGPQSGVLGGAAAVLIVVGAGVLLLARRRPRFES